MPRATPEQARAGDEKQRTSRRDRAAQIACGQAARAHPDMAGAKHRQEQDHQRDRQRAPQPGLIDDRVIPKRGKNRDS